MNTIKNYLNGRWENPAGTETLDVINPATGELLCRTPAGTSEDVDRNVNSALSAAQKWRETPVGSRIQYLFTLKKLIERDSAEIAEICTLENGKTISESKGELVRVIENIEVACGMPVMMQGGFSEDIASGIDELMIRQPVGVCACIAPFNFPSMIPFWFMPYAVACGNTYIVKPSEKVPLTMQKIFKLIDEAGFPEGVVNLVNGNKTVVDAILDHPMIKAISFVGSTPVAKYIYSRGSANGKRVQAQGGAKNSIVIMPDADVEMAVKIVADSAYGCAGQRCLAASNLILVGTNGDEFLNALVSASEKRVVGNGSAAGVEMGPVISAESKTRIENQIAIAVEEGGKVILDGRNPKIPECENGYFIKPTIIKNIDPKGALFNTEVFGPVLGVVTVNSLDEAIDLVNSSVYGNAASIFTNNGMAARKFRYHAQAGNIGINLGVPAPMAFYPFSGWKESFFGDLHGQAGHAVEFFTQTKIVIERWPKQWARQF